MIQRSEISEIGQFNKAHGVKGELNATINIDQEFFEIYNCIIVDINGIFVPFFTESVRRKGVSTILLKLEDIENDNETKPFVNKTIYCKKVDLKSFEEDCDYEYGEFADFYIGYSIFDTSLGNIGEISDIDDSTDNALFLVSCENGTFFVPITQDFIENIDDDNKVIYMNLPEGLITLND